MIQSSLFDTLAVPFGFQSDGLSPMERKVFDVLLRHRGKGSALDGKQLASQAEIDGSTRIIRRVVGALRRKHGVAVCSSLCRGNSGYYLADSAEELEEAAAWLVRLGLKILSAAARMKKKTMAEFMGQLRFDELETSDGGGEDAE